MAEPSPTLSDVEGSPSRKRDRPDEELDQMLEEAAANEKAPAWAIQMQSVVTEQVSILGQSLHGLSNRIDKLEAKRSSESDRLSSLEKQLESMSTVVQKLQGGSGASGSMAGAAAVPRPSNLNDPWSAYIRNQQDAAKGDDSGMGGDGGLAGPLGSAAAAPAKAPTVFISLPSSPASSPIRREALRETEHSHVVLGGWAQDTRRATIEQDALKVIGLFPKGLSYDRYVIFGQRASTCHISLHPLDSADAERNRFYLAQNAAGRRVQATGGDLIWVSPSRSPERRARNKITRAFLEKLEQLTKPAPPVRKWDWRLTGPSRCGSLISVFAPQNRRICVPTHMSR
ncbi:Pfkfb3 [Symbiodinium natans]|uniref:Pfkfb3 protein n=1 Tax=Symbiodinium natans TaxID=878477 RepID=A0A812Q8P1_9DINO|nr:Pfkfb3 [Symbiodinium natans]